jgi:hypothetical protein
MHARSFVALKIFLGKETSGIGPQRRPSEDPISFEPFMPCVRVEVF